MESYLSSLITVQGAAMLAGVIISMVAEMLPQFHDFHEMELTAVQKRWFMIVTSVMVAVAARWLQGYLGYAPVPPAQALAELGLLTMGSLGSSQAYHNYAHGNYDEYEGT